MLVCTPCPTVCDAGQGMGENGSSPCIFSSPGVCAQCGTGRFNPGSSLVILFCVLLCPLLHMIAGRCAQIVLLRVQPQRSSLLHARTPLTESVTLRAIRIHGTTARHSIATVTSPCIGIVTILEVVVWWIECSTSCPNGTGIDFGGTPCVSS